METQFTQIKEIIKHVCVEIEKTNPTIAQALSMIALSADMRFEVLANENDKLEVEIKKLKKQLKNCVKKPDKKGKKPRYTRGRDKYGK